MVTKLVDVLEMSVMSMSFINMGMGLALQSGQSLFRNSYMPMNPPNPGNLDIPAGLRTLKMEMKSNCQDKIEAILHELNTLNETLEFHEKLKEIKSKAEYLYTHNGLEDVNVTNLLNNSIDFLISFQNSIEDDPNIYEMVQKPLNALTVIAASVNIYNAYSSNDDDLLGKIAQSINMDKDTMRTLKELELKIYSDLMPIIGILQANSEEILNNLDNVSEMVLEIVKWKIESFY